MYLGEIDPRGSIPGLGLARWGRLFGELELAQLFPTAIPIEIEITPNKNSCAGVLPSSLLIEKP